MIDIAALAIANSVPRVNLVVSLADFAYTRPFLQPLPVWNYWYLLILPLCVAVAVVYKSIKCRSMNQVPRQAATITLWILLSFAAAAAALAGVVGLVQRMQ